MSPYRILIALLAALPLAATAQDEAPADEASPAAEEAADEGSESADGESDGEDETDALIEELEAIYDFEISDLDEQTYEEEDDDFVPTEEIPADEPIPFPTDI